MNDSRLPFWREAALSRGDLTDTEWWSGHCGQAANDERHSLGVAHGRAVARPARTIWQVEFGLRALHPLGKLGVWDAVFETLASLGPPADEEHAIDSTIVRAQKGESKSGSARPLARRLLHENPPS